MIKKYKIFKESLLNHLEGPSEEEALKDIIKKNPIKKFGLFKNKDNVNNLLITSCENGLLSGVKYAIENGADPKYSNNSIIHISASRGYLDIFKYLDTHFKLINETNIFKIITSSIYSDDAVVLQYLIETYNHKIIIPYDFKKDMLLKCVERNNINALKYLIDLGYDYRFNNYKIFFATTQQKRYEILEYLLSIGDIKHHISTYMYNFANYINDKKILDILKKYNLV